jgi:hypothetical protein
MPKFDDEGCFSGIDCDTKQSLESAGLHLEEAFELLTEQLPSTVACAIAIQVLEDLALQHERKRRN